jgi:5-methylcytosine-specific restriction endonuclease McrA
VSNNLSDIDYRSLVGSGFENCEYERKLLFSRKDNCATRATKWDIFCEEHLADSYTSVTDLIRENKRKEYSTRFPDLDKLYLDIKFSKPTEQILELRKNINKVSEELLLKQWEASMKSNFKCVLCNADLMEKEPHIDHIIPLYKGGGSETSNLQALCWECNLKKGTKIL